MQCHVVSLWQLSLCTCEYRVPTHPGKSWKVMEFKKGIFRAWKVMENGHGKLRKSHGIPPTVRGIFLTEG